MSCPREAKAKCCSAGPSADLPTRMQGKDSVTSVSLLSSLVSRRVGREGTEKGGLESESGPGEMFSTLAFPCGSLGIYWSRC